MKTYARIDGGKVAELFSTDGDITKMFHPSIVWVDVSGETAPQVGMIATQAGSAWTFAAPAGPTLADLKAEKNAEINDARLLANSTTFTHLGYVIACDPLSRSDIDAVAIKVARSGAFTAGFPMAWKAIDNRLLPLATVADFDAFYDSLTAQGTANFNHSQDLKTALAAAKTPAQVAAIVW